MPDEPSRPSPADGKPYCSFGASPRGAITLVQAGRALALVGGRGYAVPNAVVALGRDVLRHRTVPSFTALAEEVTADMILDRLLAAVPVPRVAQDSLLARAEAAERGGLVGSTAARRPSLGVDTAEAYRRPDEASA